MAIVEDYKRSWQPTKAIVNVLGSELNLPWLNQAQGNNTNTVKYDKKRAIAIGKLLAEAANKRNNAN